MLIMLTNCLSSESVPRLGPVEVIHVQNNVRCSRFNEQNDLRLLVLLLSSKDLFLLVEKQKQSHPRLRFIADQKWQHTIAVI